MSNQRVVTISGGAQGIGRATAERLVAAGARVAIGDIDLDKAQQTAAELGANALALALDVCDPDSYRGFVDVAEEILGPIDVLINNAGIMPVGPFDDESDALTDRMIDINCRGVMHGVKAILPRFQARGAGHIVNVASIAGRVAYPHGVTYCATKHFVVGMSEALGLELRGSGIDVSCVQPVLVNTELAAGVAGARLVGKVEPGDVAAAIVDAIDRRRFDVFAPRRMGAMTYALAVLPRVVRDASMRLLGADRVLIEADTAARAGYEDRAAAGAPV